GDDGATAVIDDEAFAQQPADGDAVLEERVHPGIRMWVVRWSRAVDRVAARMRSHRHNTHAVRKPAVNRLEIFVVEGLLPHDAGEGVHDCLVGDGAVLSNSRFGIAVVLAT